MSVKIGTGGAEPTPKLILTPGCSRHESTATPRPALLRNWQSESQVRLIQAASYIESNRTKLHCRSSRRRGRASRSVSRTFISKSTCCFCHRFSFLMSSCSQCFRRLQINNKLGCPDWWRTARQFHVARKNTGATVKNDPKLKALVRERNGSGFFQFFYELRRERPTRINIEIDCRNLTMRPSA
jgi:hypothetical protein